MAQEIQQGQVTPAIAKAWQASMTDPVRDELLQKGGLVDLDDLRNLFAQTTGEQAFDSEVIAGNIQRLVTDPPIDTGIAYLDLSIQTALAFIDATFQGDHPKYGVKYYGKNHHDAFVPTIIAAVDALSLWGLHDRAKQLFRYWITNFVRADGTINYYGTALSEYGQLLHMAAQLHDRSGPDGWWPDCCELLEGLAIHVLRLCKVADANDDLIPGVPEADISVADPNNVSDGAHNESNRYFHNNAWIARGLYSWAALAANAGDVKAIADRLSTRVIKTIKQTWPEDGDWWLSPQQEACEKPGTIASSTVASYANYRYWPELLSSGILPDDMAHRLVESRLNGGGQFCGMTRFGDHLDDWPLADYLLGVWRLGRIEDFKLSLFGHIAYHQAGSHLTAYEQVTLPPFREMSAPYCLPCQLVAARAGRLLNR